MKDAQAIGLPASITVLTIPAMAWRKQNVQIPGAPG